MMSTQPPQSLPSFAQAFSGSSLSRISDASTLPPIHSRPSPFEHARDSPMREPQSQPTLTDSPRGIGQASKKRSHNDLSAREDDNGSGSE